MDANKEIAAKIAKWEQDIKDGLPLRGQAFTVLCSWAEVYKQPFKRIFLKLFTYLSPNRQAREQVFLEVRPKYAADFDAFLKEKNLTHEINESASFWATVGNFFENLVGARKGEIKETVWDLDPMLEYEQVDTIMRNFPDKLQFAKKRSKGRFVHHLWRYPSTVGVFTGRYYFDPYGYLWLEVLPFYIPGHEGLAWVRETAVNYAGKEDLQGFYDSERRKALTGEEESKEKKSRMPLLLSLAMLYLSTK